MTIYIDNDYKCHTTNDSTMRAIETDAFVGKCPKYIEGYRYIPPGEMWTRSDGATFTGEMIAPWQPYEVLAAYQEAYDEAKQEDADRIAELEAIDADKTEALAIMGVVL